MKTIQLTDEQYQALANGESITIQPPKPKVERWEPKGGEWYVYGNGNILSDNSVKVFRQFGLEYQTEKQAKWARDKMRSFNRQLAWLAENDDGWVTDCNDNAQSKWYLYFNTNTKKYNIDYTSFPCLNIIYMSEANARKLATLLNNGEVEL